MRIRARSNVQDGNLRLASCQLQERVTNTISVAVLAIWVTSRPLGAAFIARTTDTILWAAPVLAASIPRRTALVSRAADAILWAAAVLAASVA